MPESMSTNIYNCSSASTGNFQYVLVYLGVGQNFSKQLLQFEVKQSTTINWNTTKNIYF